MILSTVAVGGGMSHVIRNTSPAAIAIINTNANIRGNRCRRWGTRRTGWMTIDQ
jgi:hypothetical protein